MATKTSIIELCEVNIECKERDITGNEKNIREYSIALKEKADELLLDDIISYSTAITNIANHTKNYKEDLYKYKTALEIFKVNKSDTTTDKKMIQILYEKLNASKESLDRVKSYINNTREQLNHEELKIDEVKHLNDELTSLLKSYVEWDTLYDQYAIALDIAKCLAR